eukprot:9477811-Pyramimonas_sp.AAC.3
MRPTAATLGRARQVWDKRKLLQLKPSLPSYMRPGAFRRPPQAVTKRRAERQKRQAVNGANEAKVLGQVGVPT